ncbi:MAG TPA: hypothetical protein VFO40_06045 [Chthoniobacterales bacterium]|nr:hypothetical protein [Chthoniobacterales bacterium]
MAGQLLGHAAEAVSEKFQLIRAKVPAKQSLNQSSIDWPRLLKLLLALGVIRTIRPRGSSGQSNFSTRPDAATRSIHRESALRDRTTSLLSGWQLRLAWKVAGLVLISLAIGMIFAGKYDVASDNYLYVLLCVTGLFASPFDRWAR